MLCMFECEGLLFVIPPVRSSMKFVLSDVLYSNTSQDADKIANSIDPDKAAVLIRVYTVFSDLRAPVVGTFISQGNRNA